MERRLLVERDAEGYRAKDIRLFKEPSALKALLNPVSWQILTLLSQRPMYPAEIARNLRVYEQTVYYYIRRLQRAGIITPESEKSVRGAVAKYYRPVMPAFGVELPFGERRIPVPARFDANPELEGFLGDFIHEGVFDGRIVVGSPEPHGPFRATARDGHYATQLAFFLGQLCRMPDDFVVKLDVDVKVEKREGDNLILIGGPGTNLMTASVNPHLPIHFTEKNYWGGLIDVKGTVFSDERDGLVSKIRNPFNQDRSLIVLAGKRSIGTKAAVIALTQFWRDALKAYQSDGEWATVIRGYDMDGDGKVDSVEVIRRFSP